SENLAGVPQTTASLYMRLAKNKDRLAKPSAEISNGVARLAAEGQLSVRRAAALLVEKKARGAKPKPKTDEDKAREFLRALALDEHVLKLREWFDADYVDRLSKALAPKPQAQPMDRRA